MKLALVIVLTGCNQIFGLDETVTYDARHNYFDAMVDAPPSCAAPSVTPQFDRELHQAIYADQNCTAYQISAVGIALASCTDAQYKQNIYEGRVGPISGMQPALGELNHEGDYTYSFALLPEGSEALVSRYDATFVRFGVWQFKRDATGIWRRQDELPFPSGSIATLSPVTRGPERHVLVRTNADNDVHEWSNATGTWTDIATYVPADFNSTYPPYGLDLSADGLRLALYIYDSTAQAYVMAYSYRDNIGDRFSLPVPLPTAPNTQNLFITEDCDRAYFAGFGAVFFVRRVL